jgi:hypothetical protein
MAHSPSNTYKLWDIAQGGMRRERPTRGDLARRDGYNRASRRPVAGRRAVYGDLHRSPRDNKL